MPSNRGATSLRRRRRAEHPMAEFDRLPAELRGWLASAALPWRPRSARLAYDRALAQTGDVARAIARLDSLQDSLIAKDCSKVWGPNHPNAARRAIGLHP
ncbi:MAG: DUF6525 family protein [Pseudomonadota bacterium]